MTSYTKTITNTVGVFGGKQTDKWGSLTAKTMVWGTDKWAFGSGNLLKSLGKLITNTMTVSGNITGKSVGFTKTISNTMVISGDLSDEERFDTVGYNILFGDAKNAENRALTSYTEDSGNTASYTTQTVTATSWT